jgi:hypothetical protein
MHAYPFFERVQFDTAILALLPRRTNTAVTGYVQRVSCPGGMSCNSKSLVAKDLLRKVLGLGKMALFAANFAVVFHRHLEDLVTLDAGPLSTKTAAS